MSRIRGQPSPPRPLSHEGRGGGAPRATTPDAWLNKVRQGRLFAALGAAAGAAAALIVGAARQAGRFEDVSPRYLAGAAVPALLAVAGLALYGRRPRLGAAVVMAAAGWTAGNVVAGSGAGAGLFWAPAAVLLIQGAYLLLTAARRPGSGPRP